MTTLDDRSRHEQLRRFHRNRCWQLPESSLQRPTAAAFDILPKPFQDAGLLFRGDAEAGHAKINARTLTWG